MRTLCKAAVIATLLAAPVSQAARAEDSGSYAARLREESDRRMEDYFEESNRRFEDEIQQRGQEDREYELNRKNEEYERRLDRLESQQRERHIWE